MFGVLVDQTQIREIGVIGAPHALEVTGPVVFKRPGVRGLLLQCFDIFPEAIDFVFEIGRDRGCFYCDTTETWTPVALDALGYAR